MTLVRDQITLAVGITCTKCMKCYSYPRCYMVLLEKLGDKQKRVVENIFILHNRYKSEGQNHLESHLETDDIFFSAFLGTTYSDVFFCLYSSLTNTKLSEVSDGAAEDQCCILSIKKTIMLCLSQEILNIGLVHSGGEKAQGRLYCGLSIP